MCCFSRPIEDVSETKIFARLGSGVSQFVAYSMQMSAKEDLSMVLPIPVVKGTDEKDVKFINLEKYPRMFDDLWSGFPVPRSSFLGDPLGPAAAAGEPKAQ